MKEIIKGISPVFAIIGALYLTTDLGKWVESFSWYGEPKKYEYGMVLVCLLGFGIIYVIAKVRELRAERKRKKSNDVH